MACGELTDGYRQPNCKPTPGAKQSLWIALFDDIASWSNGTSAGEKESVTMKATKGLYKFQVERDTVDVSHTKVDEDGGGVNMTHECSLKIVDRSLEARDRINDLLGKDLVLFVEENSGVIDIIGHQNGCRLDVADGSTVVTDLGHSLTFRAKKQSTLPLQFNNGTSLATTIDDLEALVIGS